MVAICKLIFNSFNKTKLSDLMMDWLKDGIIILLISLFHFKFYYLTAKTADRGYAISPSTAATITLM